MLQRGFDCPPEATRPEVRDEHGAVEQLESS